MKGFFSKDTDEKNIKKNIEKGCIGQLRILRVIEYERKI